MSPASYRTAPPRRRMLATASPRANPGSARGGGGWCRCGRRTASARLPTLRSELPGLVDQSPGLLDLALVRAEVASSQRAVRGPEVQHGLIQQLPDLLRQLPAPTA